VIKEREKYVVQLVAKTVKYHSKPAEKGEKPLGDKKCARVAGKKLYGGVAAKTGKGKKSKGLANCFHRRPERGGDREKIFK